MESGFRQLKDVLAMRPIYHQIEQRVKAHIFVAALACSWSKDFWADSSKRRESICPRRGRWRQCQQCG